jgi:hypothetical protein
MNQYKCVFCSRSDVVLTLLGSGRACPDCIGIAHRLIHSERFTPNNTVEEAVLSLIFFLETDLIFTRQLLNSQSLNDDLQMVVRHKREKLVAIDVHYSDVRECYIKKIKNLINEHSVLLDLYTDLP